MANIPVRGVCARRRSVAGSEDIMLVCPVLNTIDATRMRPPERTNSTSSTKKVNKILSIMLRVSGGEARC